jgi:DNA-binding response OmpR family regulator
MRVLIVDDSRVCRRMYRKELERGGYECFEAADGVEALQVIHEVEVDLVALDVEMPNMDGYEVCERLRSEEFTTHFQSNRDKILPVIFVTSNETLEGRVKGFNKGATDFIIKGFKPGTLLATVNRVLKPVNPLAGLRALVVEDSRFIRNMLTRFLGENGVEVVEASNGQDAFDLLCKPDHDFDVVITDLEMPDMRGDTLCRKVRRDLGMKGIPVIILTASNDHKLLLNLFESGATDYLVKPFEKEELLARMKVSLEVINALKEELAETKRREEVEKVVTSTGSTSLAEEPAEEEISASKQAENYATSVLHNIGNVLNSVHLGCYDLNRRLRESKLSQMLLAHELLRENRSRLGTFFTQDPKGKILPDYLLKIGEKIEEEQVSLLNEVEAMATRIELMKDIIQTQQASAKGETFAENVDLHQVLEESLKVLHEQIDTNSVIVRKMVSPTGPIRAQKVKLSHVIINLVKNAIEAMRDVEDRVLTIKLSKTNGKSLTLSIEDTGIGMSEKVLAHLFTHGFTTKEDGHGFGLSYCANAINGMGGKLEAFSAGDGRGANFTITMPLSSQTS